MPYSHEICGIYKISFGTQKVYIGSSFYCKLRRCQHLMNLRSGRHVNTHLQNAFDKYSEESFIYEIIEEIDCIQKLKEREIFWIQFYNSCNREFGYNKYHVDREDYNRKRKERPRKGVCTGDNARKRTKLTWEDVNKIRKVYYKFKKIYNKKQLCKNIGVYYCVGYGCIYDVVSNRSWMKEN